MRFALLIRALASRLQRPPLLRLVLLLALLLVLLLVHVHWLVDRLRLVHAGIDSVRTRSRSSSGLRGCRGPIAALGAWARRRLRSARFCWL
jgi:hypothetical protein